MGRLTVTPVLVAALALVAFDAQLALAQWGGVDGASAPSWLTPPFADEESDDLPADVVAEALDTIRLAGVAAARDADLVASPPPSAPATSAVTAVEPTPAPTTAAPRGRPRPRESAAEGVAEFLRRFAGDEPVFCDAVRDHYKDDLVRGRKPSSRFLDALVTFTDIMAKLQRRGLGREKSPAGTVRLARGVQRALACLRGLMPRFVVGRPGGSPRMAELQQTCARSVATFEVEQGYRLVKALRRTLLATLEGRNRVGRLLHATKMDELRRLGEDLGSLEYALEKQSGSAGAPGVMTQQSCPPQSTLGREVMEKLARFNGWIREQLGSHAASSAD